MKKKIIGSILNILKSLNSKQRNRLIILTSLILISALLEAAGISLVIPLVSLILDPQSLIENKFVGSLFNNKFTNTELIYFFIGMACLFYISKNIFILFLNWIQNKMINKTSLELSQKLYRVYLNSPYEFHTKTNKSVLYNNVSHVTTFITGLEALMMLVAELLILIGILFVLMYFELVGTIIILLVFILCSSIIFLLTSQKLANWGKWRFQYKEKKIRIVNQVFTGIKEIKILNRIKFFYDEFTLNEKKDLDLSNKAKIVNLIPRLSFEVVFILCISSFIFYKFNSDFAVNNIIIILALYAAAFFRIFPSALRIVFNINTIINVSKIIEKIHSELNSLKENPKPFNSKTIFFGERLSISDVNFKFDKRSKQILNSINLDINFGEKIGIVGETGSGKSTFANLITGLIKPQSGNVLIDGQNIHTNIESWQKQIGYVFPETFIINESIKKNIALGIEETEIDEKIINQVIGKSELSSFIENLPEKVNTKIGEDGAQISSGQKQRIGLARALYLNPKLLILDEATSSLNKEIEKKILDGLENFGREITIIIISHRDTTLTKCDKIFKIENGFLKNIK